MRRPRRANIPTLKPRIPTVDTRIAKPPGFIVAVEEDFFALLDGLPRNRPAVLTYKSDAIPDLVQCCNPRCRNGGLNLSPFAKHAGEQTIRCRGYEGSSRDGQQCDNHWNVTVSRRRPVLGTSRRRDV